MFTTTVEDMKDGEDTVQPIDKIEMLKMNLIKNTKQKRVLLCEPVLTMAQFRIKTEMVLRCGCNLCESR